MSWARACQNRPCGLWAAQFAHDSRQTRRRLLAPCLRLSPSRPRAMAVNITQAQYDSLISRLAAVEEENAATLLEVDT